MALSIKEIAGAFVVLFAILDITGSIPIIIDLQHKTGKVPGVDIESFAVAGSIIILAIGFEMTFDITIFKYDAGPKEVSSFVPLVFPLIVGAGSFTTLLSLKAEYAAINIMIALFLNMVFIFVVLKSIDRIEKILGPGLIYVLRKFFGIILLAIAVKLFTSNIGHLIG